MPATAGIPRDDSPRDRRSNVPSHRSLDLRPGLRHRHARFPRTHRVGPDDQARRAQQLQAVPGLPRPLPQGHGTRGRPDQRSGRRARPKDRSRVARRQRRSRRCGPRRRGVADPRARRAADGSVRIERRARRFRLRPAAQGAVPRRRTPDRQDRLAGRQCLYVPAAGVDVHADRDARARRGQDAGRSAGRSSIRTTNTDRPRPRPSSAR